MDVPHQTPAPGTAAAGDGIDHGYTWDEDDPGTAGHPPRWVLPALVVPIVALIIANNVGAIRLADALPKDGSGLVAHPLQILALNSTNKVLLATGYQTEWWAFMLVASLRLLAPDPLFYALGRLYRAPALRWGRSVFPGSDKLFDLFEHEDHRGVRRLLDALVLIMPNNPVCLLAGIARMPLARFWTLNIVGTLGRTALFLWISHLFREEIASLLNSIGRYQQWALWITVGLVVVFFAVQARRLTTATEELAED